MSSNLPLPRFAAVARPRFLKRAALFTSGAVTGMVVSVVASYAVIGVMIPRGPEAASHVSQDPNARHASLNPIEPIATAITRLPAIEAPAAAPRAAVAALANVAVDPAAITRLPAEPSIEPVPNSSGVSLARAPADDIPAIVPEPARPSAAAQQNSLAARPPAAPSIAPADVIEPLAAPAVTVIEAAPDVVPPARPDQIETIALARAAGLPDRALAHPVARPESGISPQDFAALSNGDALGRSAATIGFSGVTGPEPRPDRLAAVDPAVTTPEIGMSSVEDDDTTLSALVEASLPDMPRTRPHPRPAGLMQASFTVAQLDEVPAAIPALRPQPRPDLVRVASAAIPAPTPVAAADPAPRSRVARGVCGNSLTRDMPRRRSGAETGSAFFAGLGGLSGTERDNRVIAELARGNMPKFLRDLQPVRFTGQDGRGKATEIIICVSPDYLALGSDRDYVRTPLGLPAASRIAAAFDMTLPTPRMVDAIYAQADVHLSPSPMTPGPQMSSTAYLLRHNATIQGQLHGRSGLIAGQKKDVVMASRMASNPGKVAIYGWHRSNTRPIQPVSTVHQASYADYSHGIRLVSRTAFLDGRPVDIDDLLASSRYASLINSDGPLPGRVIQIASR